jgi:hypothetical protein
MEIIRAGKPNPKIEAECVHCTSLHRFDQRSVALRFVNFPDKQGAAFWNCSHCTNVNILSIEQQTALEIGESSYATQWLARLSTLSERGKANVKVQGEGFIRQVRAFATPSPATPSQSEGSPQSPPPPSPTSVESLEVLG